VAESSFKLHQNLPQILQIFKSQAAYWTPDCATLYCKKFVRFLLEKTPNDPVGCQYISSNLPINTSMPTVLQTVRLYSSTALSIPCKWESPWKLCHVAAMEFGLKLASGWYKRLLISGSQELDYKHIHTYIHWHTHAQTYTNIEQIICHWKWLRPNTIREFL